MTAIEAMIYCLGHVDNTVIDGERHSQTCYDCNGEPHWFAWNVNQGKAWSMPRMCSGSAYHFAGRYEPYTTKKRCDHPRLNMDGICFKCGEDCRGAS